MPFEPAPKDLPPAAKLAALIEAGRAANPDLKHGTGYFLNRGAACAIGFAALANGARREWLDRECASLSMLVDEVNRTLSSIADFEMRMDVWALNDNGASLEEICASLREGELAKVPA